MDVARRVVVHGRVQGVGFRYACERRAGATGVAGWVRNTPEGTVEVHLEGAEDAVAAMVDWLHQGPRPAEVTSVEVREDEPEHRTGFTVR